MTDRFSPVRGGGPWARTARRSAGRWWMDSSGGPNRRRRLHECAGDGAGRLPRVVTPVSRSLQGEEAAVFVRSGRSARPGARRRSVRRMRRGPQAPAGRSSVCTPRVGIGHRTVKLEARAVRPAPQAPRAAPIGRSRLPRRPRRPDRRAPATATARAFRTRWRDASARRPARVASSTGSDDGHLPEEVAAIAPSPGSLHVRPYGVTGSRS